MDWLQRCFGDFKLPTEGTFCSIVKNKDAPRLIKPGLIKPWVDKEGIDPKV